MYIHVNSATRLTPRHQTLLQYYAVKKSATLSLIMEKSKTIMIGEGSKIYQPQNEKTDIPKDRRQRRVKVKIPPPHAKKSEEQMVKGPLGLNLYKTQLELLVDGKKSLHYKQ